MKFLTFAAAFALGYVTAWKVAPTVQAKMMAYSMDMDNVWDVWGHEAHDRLEDGDE
jgi:hypothetical protein